MKYIKTFEYRENRNLLKIYPGRFIDTIKDHCKMLDKRGINYSIYADIDIKGDQDLVMIIIDDDSKELFNQKMKTLGFRSQNINLSDWKKFNSVEDYLKNRGLNESKEIIKKSTTWLFPTDSRFEHTVKNSNEFKRYWESISSIFRLDKRTMRDSISGYSSTNPNYVFLTLDNSKNWSWMGFDLDALKYCDKKNITIIGPQGMSQEEYDTAMAELEAEKYNL